MFKFVFFALTFLVTLFLFFSVSFSVSAETCGKVASGAAVVSKELREVLKETNRSLESLRVVFVVNASDADKALTRVRRIVDRSLIGQNGGDSLHYVQTVETEEQVFIYVTRPPNVISAIAKLAYIKKADLADDLGFNSRIKIDPELQKVLTQSSSSAKMLVRVKLSVNEESKILEILPEISQSVGSIRNRILKKWLVVEATVEQIRNLATSEWVESILPP